MIASKQTDRVTLLAAHLMGFPQALSTQLPNLTRLAKLKHEEATVGNWWKQSQITRNRN
jgi:hypothetical protein